MNFRKLLLFALIMSFISVPAMAHWLPDDGHKMHFPQLPDKNGWDVPLYPIMVADDFKCSESGPITDIHFWVSWKDDVVGEVFDWYIAIHADADGRPGDILWKYKTGNIAVRHEEPSKQGWLNPYGKTEDETFIPKNHTKYSLINVTEIEDPFKQEEGTIYWLVIHAYSNIDSDGVVQFQARWKTSLDAFNYPAMWSPGPWSASPIGWRPIPTPSSYEQVDMAFVINRTEQPQRLMDFGDADETKSNSYPTTLMRNGARHLIDWDVYMGSPMLTYIQIDADDDGQPTPLCDGDDLLDSYDDEQAVYFVNEPLTPNTYEEVVVSVSTKGYIDAWIDFNADGDWDDRGEKICYSTPVVAGSNTISFYVSGTTADNVDEQRITSSRFRFSTEGGLNYYGFAPDGEVEDYIVKIGPDPQPLMDYGDAPDGDFVPGGYPTLLINNGARHKINPKVYLGRYIDPERDGQPTIAANGDDITDLSDEDGVSFAGPLVPGQDTEIKVIASCEGYLYGWVDFEANNSWADPIDQVFLAEPVSAGVNYLKISTPNINQVDNFATYARFRFVSIDTTTVPLSFYGPANDGEVEDYLIKVVPEPLFDFGDAPELRCDDPDVTRCNTYPTTLARNGARHYVDRSIFLGDPYIDYIQIDEEFDGQPTIAADGDDINDFDDEQGVFFVTPVVAGMPAMITAWASVDGYLDAWIDFNNDGDWDDSGEQIFASEALSLGQNDLVFHTPPYPQTVVTNSVTYARFRFSTYGGLNYMGPARNGEVEDYTVKIIEPERERDLGDAPDSTNSFSIPMYAYHGVGLADVIIKANYPTVYQIGSPPHGPVHFNPVLVAHLGKELTREYEADYGYDEDPLNNLIPPLDKPNLDKADDGVQLPINLPHKYWTSFDYSVRVYYPMRKLYVNAWFDFNRDGDWDDIIPFSNDNRRKANEWAVQNQVLSGLAPGLHTITTPSFLSWHPATFELEMPYIWMRITISEKPWEPQISESNAVGYGGSGPKDGYWIGETEDYFFVPTADIRKSADLNDDEKVDILDFEILASQWLDGVN